jgi:hypothetical protein
MTRLIKFHRAGQELADWLNPDRIILINFGDSHATIELTEDFEARVTAGEADRIVAEINADAPPSAAANGIQLRPGETRVDVGEMVLDGFYSKTANETRRMWRCKTTQGISFNIFHHVDHRDTYALFADYHWIMDDMSPGDELDCKTPIPVEVVRNGDFYNPVKVLPVEGPRNLVIHRAEGSDSDDDS